MEVQTQEVRATTQEPVINVERKAISRETVLNLGTEMMNGEARHQNQESQRRKQLTVHSTSSVRNANREKGSGLDSETFIQTNNTEVKLKDKQLQQHLFRQPLLESSLTVPLRWILVKAGICNKSTNTEGNIKLGPIRALGEDS